MIPLIAANVHAAKRSADPEINPPQSTTLGIDWLAAVRSTWFLRFDKKQGNPQSVVGECMIGTHRQVISNGISASRLECRDRDAA